MPLANNLKNIMLNENVDIKVIDKIKKLGHSISFNETFFVCAEGDNTDGSSWEHAYTDIQTALDAASTDSDKCALILLSPIAGTTRYDINTTGDPTWTGNYAIVGIARHFASIKNSHASATSTLKFTGKVYLANFSIYMNTDNNGIIIGANGSEIHNIGFNGENLTSGASGLILEGSSSLKHITIDGCHFHGDSTLTNFTGITFAGAYDCLVKDCNFHDGLLGINLTHADDDDDHFRNLELHNCATGIKIDLATCVNNHFREISFTLCTTNIDDGGTDTILQKIGLESLSASVAPADLTGVVVTAGVGANTWTVACTEIRSAVAATKPFYVTGLVFDPDTLEKWGLRLYDDGGTTPFWEGVLEGLAAVANRSQRVLFADKVLIAQGTQICSRAKSETGGNNIDVWLKIEEI